MWAAGLNLLPSATWSLADPNSQSVNVHRYEAQTLVLSAIMTRWRSQRGLSQLSSAEWKRFESEVDRLGLALLAGGDLIRRTPRGNDTSVSQCHQAWRILADVAWEMLVLHETLMQTYGIKDYPSRLLLNDCLNSCPVYPRPRNAPS